MLPVPIDNDDLIKKLRSQIRALRNDEYIQNIEKQVKELSAQKNALSRQLIKSSAIANLEDKAIIWDDGYYADDDQANPYRKAGAERRDVIVARRQALANLHQMAKDNKNLRKKIDELESSSITRKH